MDNKKNKVIHDANVITDHDIYLLKEGKHRKLYNKLGSRLMTLKGTKGEEVKGVYFAVWAPNAERVSVVGDFNGWKHDSHPLGVRWDESGIWEGFVPNLENNERYKYHIVSKTRDLPMQRGDPYAFSWETPPKTASVVWDLDYEWGDKEWISKRERSDPLSAPLSIYEVHIGSWRPGLSYRELAKTLASYVLEMGFTHVELMPVMEHPFYGSWGYQTTGYFAPTRRYGTPQDFMYLVDYLHQKGIGVILDWVPSHFPSDEHGLYDFDGTHLYEHEDVKKGFHPEWKSHIFNYGRREVKEFLINSALFWLEYYHADGIRVDAVASMLYLDYARKDGEWEPNRYGGRENLEAIEFLKELNQAVYNEFPGTVMMAEESTDWPMVSRPTYAGGLGFGMKWNMGWMHDTLKYFSKDTAHRKYHHDELIFSICYAFTENFLLPLSHDEVVYGKGSLLNKMPGDEWQKFAGLRLLFGYMYTHPGKKLLFMGGEWGQRAEWNHDAPLEWGLLEYPLHCGVKTLVADLNRLHTTEPALFEADFEEAGFEWIDCRDVDDSVITYLRKARSTDELIVVSLNFTQVVRHNYRVGVPEGGLWKELVSTDGEAYGGSGLGNPVGLEAEKIARHARPWSISLTLPPLAAVVLKHCPD